MSKTMWTLKIKVMCACSYLQTCSLRHGGSTWAGFWFLLCPIYHSVAQSYPEQRLTESVIHTCIKYIKTQQNITSQNICPSDALSIHCSPQMTFREQKTHPPPHAQSWKNTIWERHATTSWYKRLKRWKHTLPRRGHSRVALLVWCQ